jgi:hypothetical protein
MFFHESEVIVREHPDLLRVVEQVDRRLSGICSGAPLRPGDFSCALGADENQVVSVFELLARKEVLHAENMVECERCQNLMSADAFRQAVEDEDAFECTACGRVFPRRSEPVGVYRMTASAVSRTKAVAKPLDLQISEMFGLTASEEPLSERAQHVLLAMLELNAIDSDRRRSTETVSRKALGGTDANALKSVMVELKTRRLINSKTGRGGGCWLTDNGRQRAEKLRNPNRNSATV